LFLPNYVVNPGERVVPTGNLVFHWGCYRRTPIKLEQAAMKSPEKIDRVR